jgi:hypothetical protein
MVVVPPGRCSMALVAERSDRYRTSQDPHHVMHCITHMARAVDRT